MKKFLLIIILLVCSPQLLAAFSCNVTVKNVLVYSNGTVNILHTGRNDHTVICNTKGAWKDVDTVTCSHWISMLQNAQSNDKLVRFYYDGDGSCQTLPTYGNAPVPVYIGFVK